MSYVEEITVVQNDYGYDLEFQITDAQGNPVDLTGAMSINIFIFEKGSTVAKVVGTCEVSGNPANGICKYTVQSGDFNEAPKKYNVEIEVNYVGRTITAKGVRIKVLREAPEVKG